jgi:deazaflavin-dependent oxidoreductase (nitroreductase family)
VIEEFRRNQGKVGGPFDGRSIVIVTMKGRKTGREITKPLVYVSDKDRVIVVGSKGGAPTHPEWYLNIVANPVVTVEVPGDTYQARAVVQEGVERDRLWQKMVDAMPFFADYQTKTTRQIPVLALERVK